ncbi:hypothetical protein FRC03_008489 [Tulasnella sp. 419]|nr:hypothetical protein FRC03_008489 [Tulasnella sp. 419]
MSLDLLLSYTSCEAIISRPRQRRNTRSNTIKGNNNNNLSTYSTSVTSSPDTSVSSSYGPSDALTIRNVFEDLNARLQDIHSLLLHLDDSLTAQAARTKALEKSLTEACEQLEDHEVYFPARYPPPPPPNTDYWERRKRAEASWAACRLENAGISKLTDLITTLPYLNGAYPPKFPRRLAGLLTLRERQVEGFLHGYAQVPILGSLDRKRRQLAIFVGIDPVSFDFANQQLSSMRRRGEWCSF